MKKMIKNYSVIVMIVLLITGCGKEKSTLPTVGAFLTDGDSSSTSSDIEPSNTSEKPISTDPTTLSTPIPVISSSPVSKPSTYIALEASSTPSEEPKTISTPAPTPVPSPTTTPSPVPSTTTILVNNTTNINIPVNVNGTNNNFNATPTPKEKL